MSLKLGDGVPKTAEALFANEATAHTTLTRTLDIGKSQILLRMCELPEADSIAARSQQSETIPHRLMWLVHAVEPAKPQLPIATTSSN